MINYSCDLQSCKATLSEFKKQNMEMKMFPYITVSRQETEVQLQRKKQLWDFPGAHMNN